MRKILIGLLIIFDSCVDRPNEIITVAFDKDTVYLMPADSRRPTALELTISGYGNDTFMVNNILFNPGTLDTLLKMDWYNDPVAINFKRLKATKGNLKISYKTY